MNTRKRSQFSFWPKKTWIFPKFTCYHTRGSSSIRLIFVNRFLLFSRRFLRRGFLAIKSPRFLLTRVGGTRIRRGHRRKSLKTVTDGGGRGHRNTSKRMITIIRIRSAVATTHHIDIVSVLNNKTNNSIRRVRFLSLSYRSCINTLYTYLICSKRS